MLRFGSGWILWAVTAAAAAAHLQWVLMLYSHKLPSLFHLDPEVTHMSYWKSGHCLWERECKVQWNSVLLGFLRCAAQGCPLCSLPGPQASALAGKGCGPALALFHFYLLSPWGYSALLYSSFHVGCRGPVVHSVCPMPPETKDFTRTVSRATDL